MLVIDIGAGTTDLCRMHGTMPEDADQETFDVAGDAHNGARVDPATCATVGSGARELCAVWEDPGFDRAQRAFYYVRVLEIPTPRWTTHDAKVFGVKLPTDVPATLQERAYSSPIWYTPD